MIEVLIERAGYWIFHTGDINGKERTETITIPAGQPGYPQSINTLYFLLTNKPNPYWHGTNNWYIKIYDYVPA